MMHDGLYLHFIEGFIFIYREMSIFSELIEDYFLSNIKNNLFEDEDTEENEPVSSSKCTKCRSSKYLM